MIITLEQFADLHRDMTDFVFEDDGSIIGTHPSRGRVRFTPVDGITGRGLLEHLDLKRPAALTIEVF